MSTEHRPVYRTIIKVAVLSEGGAFVDFDSLTELLDHFISETHGIGSWIIESVQEVPPNLVEAALRDVGNDGSFFDEEVT